MKALILSDVIYSPYNETFTYDKCILSLISQQENISIRFLNPKEEIYYTTGLKEEKFKTLERVLSSNEISSACENPMNMLHIRYAQEKSSTYITTEKNTNGILEPSQSKLLL